MQIPHDILRLTGYERLVGPWLCEQCGKVSQFAIIQSRKNRVFCRNESCGFERIIDKHNSHIVEADGTHWAFDSTGNKWRVRA